MLVVVVGQVEEAIEFSPLSTAKLDLVCAYLKRVYFFVYYRGHQCRDEGDMIASRSACRGSEAASKEQVAEVSKGRWILERLDIKRIVRTQHTWNDGNPKSPTLQIITPLVKLSRELCVPSPTRAN